MRFKPNSWAKLAIVDADPAPMSRFTHCKSKLTLDLKPGSVRSRRKNCTTYTTAVRPCLHPCRIQHRPSYTYRVRPDPAGKTSASNPPGQPDCCAQIPGVQLGPAGMFREPSAGPQGTLQTRPRSITKYTRSPTHTQKHTSNCKDRECRGSTGGGPHPPRTPNALAGHLRPNEFSRVGAHAHLH